MTALSPPDLNVRSLLESGFDEETARKSAMPAEEYARRRQRLELLTLLYRENAPFDNNHAARMIRNAAVMRKNSYCNRRLGGAETQTAWISVFQTLKQLGSHGTRPAAEELREHPAAKNLPHLPKVK